MTVQDEMIHIFVKESQAHIQTIETELFNLKSEFGTLDDPVLNNLLRSIHSIKSAAGFYHFNQVKLISNEMEKLFSQIRFNAAPPDSKVTGALAAASSALEKMFNNIQDSDDADIDNELRLLSDCLQKKDSDGNMIKIHEMVRSGSAPQFFEISEEKLAYFLKEGFSLYTLEFLLKEDLSHKGQTLYDLINAINSRGELIESNVNVNNIQGLSDCLENDLSFIALFATKKTLETISHDLDIPKDRIFTIDLGPFLKNDIEDSDTLYLMPESDLVASRIERLRDEFLTQMKATPSVKRIVLKADKIENMDSLGVNLVIGLFRQATAESKTFEITGAGERFLKVANFFQFPALFTITKKDA